MPSNKHAWCGLVVNAEIIDSTAPAAARLSRQSVNGPIRVGRSFSSIS